MGWRKTHKKPNPISSYCGRARKVCICEPKLIIFSWISRISPSLPASFRRLPTFSTCSEICIECQTGSNYNNSWSRTIFIVFFSFHWKKEKSLHLHFAKKIAKSKSTKRSENTFKLIKNYWTKSEIITHVFFGRTQIQTLSLSHSYEIQKWTRTKKSYTIIFSRVQKGAEIVLRFWVEEFFT